MNVPKPRIEMSPRTRRFMRELADEDWEESLSHDARDDRAKPGKLIDALRAVVQGRATPERIG